MLRTLLSIYSHSPRRFDEMLDAGGKVRPHWQEFFEHLDHASPELMRQRLDFIDRRIQENGVTYNVYADPNGADRPWSIDPLPLILAADEWRQIEAAVSQRARLIDATLADLYGEQRMLKEGALPPALVYGQRGYLWPCQGIKPVGGHFLHVYACDLARSPDGRWWVIADRTQAPAGAGYALENRLIVSRVFPELFRDLKVQHLAYFFHALQNSLAQWAPVEDGETPHIVLLTPGHYNETYFEHAYLARYLGFPLVEGQDLTVRGDTVYLKTLTGLKRVHVILRRQDDSFCDPLELRSDSALGIPGLLQAVRRGRVLVTNALGSGLMGSGALMGFLPGICQRLLGEELLLPSVATWWCGEQPAMEYVVEHFDQLVIKGAYPEQRMEPQFGRELRGMARQALLHRIRQMPHAYVAQEMVNLAQMPTWSRTHERRLLARSVGLRVYAVATPKGYVLMPGGLTRVAGDANAHLISMQRGGAAKDTWVLTGDGEVNTLSLLKTGHTVHDLVRSGSNLSSRVVENLYWTGRYAERFDDTARVLRVALSRLLDAGGEDSAELHSVLELAERLELLPSQPVPTPGIDPGQDKSREPAPTEPAQRLRLAIYNHRSPNSLAGNIHSLLWSATQVRERLSLDHWHSLNRLQNQLQEAATQTPTLGEAQAFLDQVLLVSSSLSGFALDNMTRDDGWRFLIVGRHLERVGFLARTLAEFLRLSSARQANGLEWLLELGDSIITYRSRYLSQPELLPVLDLLVFDDSNPHSVIFQLLQLRRILHTLGQHLGSLPQAEPLGGLVDELRAFDLNLFAGVTFQECGGDGDCCNPCARLATLLYRIVIAAATFSDELGNRFFTHVGQRSQHTLAT